MAGVPRGTHGRALVIQNFFAVKLGFHVEQPTRG